MTDRRIMGLDSSIRSDALAFINQVSAELGVDLRVSQGMRTIEEQNNLYAQGRTRAQLDAVGLTDVNPRSGPIVTNAYGSQSYHTSGMAIDVVRLNANGSINWTPIDRSIANIGARYGFQWGGDFRRPDYPHFERR